MASFAAVSQQRLVAHTGIKCAPSTAVACSGPQRLASRALLHTARPARQPASVRCQAAAAEAEVAAKPAAPPSYASTSDKYAVIDVGGTQHLVEEGRWYTCNRLQAEPGSKIQFGRVLAMKEEGVFTVGRPYLENVAVEAQVVEELKGPKLTVYKMKPKKHYRRTTGHRQPLTKFLVTKITTN